MMIYVLLGVDGSSVFNESDNGEFDANADEFDTNNSSKSFVTQLDMAPVVQNH